MNAKIFLLFTALSLSIFPILSLAEEKSLEDREAELKAALAAAESADKAAEKAALAAAESADKAAEERARATKEAADKAAEEVAKAAGEFATTLVEKMAEPNGVSTGAPMETERPRPTIVPEVFLPTVARLSCVAPWVKASLCSALLPAITYLNRNSEDELSQWQRKLLNGLKNMLSQIVCV